MSKKKKNNIFYIIGFIILLIILAYFLLNKKNNKGTSSSSENPTCYKNGPLFSCTKANLNAQPKCANNPNNNIPYNKNTRCCNGSEISTVGNPLRFDLFCPNCFKTGPIMSCTKPNPKAKPICTNSPNNDFAYNDDTKCCNGLQIEYDGTPTKYTLSCPTPRYPLILSINVLKSFTGTNYFIDLSELDEYRDVNKNKITSVDWGDNSAETTDLKHQYAIPGKYNIKIYGNINYLVFTNFFKGGDVASDMFQIGIEEFGSSFNTLKVINFNVKTDITNIPLVLPKTVIYLSFNSVKSICDITKLDVSNITHMSNMFNLCTTFNQDISGWNVENVIYMDFMFSGCTNFNQPLNWNVSSVTDMSYMFHGCTNFNQPLDNWNVSNVRLMSYMFSNCKNFNQPLNWGNKVSNVIYMNNMFSSCEIFNQPLNSWNVSNVTNMNEMFYSCKKFNQPLDKWDVSKVTEMNGIFRDCTEFNKSLCTWVSNIKDKDALQQDDYLANQVYICPHYF
jgi:surface protein